MKRGKIIIFIRIIILFWTNGKFLIKLERNSFNEKLSIENLNKDNNVEIGNKSFNI